MVSITATGVALQKKNKHYYIGIHFKYLYFYVSSAQLIYCYVTFQGY